MSAIQARTPIPRNAGSRTELPMCHPAGAPAQPARVSGSASLPRCRPSSYAARSREMLAAGQNSPCVIPQERRRSRRECRDRRPDRNVSHPGTHPDPDTRSLRSLLRDDTWRASSPTRVSGSASLPQCRPSSHAARSREMLAAGQNSPWRHPAGAAAQPARVSGSAALSRWPPPQARSPIPTLARFARSCGMTREEASVPARVSGSASLSRCRLSSYAARSRHSLASLAPAG